MFYSKSIHFKNISGHWDFKKRDSKNTWFLPPSSVSLKVSLSHFANALRAQSGCLQPSDAHTAGAERCLGLVFISLWKTQYSRFWKEPAVFTRQNNPSVSITDQMFDQVCVSVRLKCRFTLFILFIYGNDFTVSQSQKCLNVVDIKQKSVIFFSRNKQIEVQTTIPSAHAYPSSFWSLIQT